MSERGLTVSMRYQGSIRTLTAAREIRLLRRSRTCLQSCTRLGRELLQSAKRATVIARRVDSHPGKEQAWLKVQR
jgi:hypothetical protein